MASGDYDKNKYRDEIKETVKEYLTVVHKSADYFEKQLSYISAGSLGLSFIIVEKIFGDISQTQYKGALIFSWALLAITLIINLFSHSYATKCHNNTIEEMYDFIAGVTEDYDNSNSQRRTRNINILNNISFLFLSLGIALLIIYTSLNITKMADEKNKQPSQPKIERKSPDLSDRATSIANKGSLPKDSKVHDIKDGGHPGIPTKKPDKKI